MSRSSAAVASTSEVLRTFGLRGRSSTRDLLRRLEPTPMGRNWQRWLFPAVGLLVIAIGVAILVNLTSGGDSPAGQPLVNPSVGEMAQATVQIVGLDASGKPLCSGSGTFVSTDGLILTNAHVVTRDQLCDFDTIGVAVTTDAGKAPKLLYQADLVRADPVTDLAVIRVTMSLDPAVKLPTSFPAFALGDSDSLKIGDPLRILGYPEIGGVTITLTDGAVSGFNAQDGIGERALIKTDATIAGGNSGGAAVDAAGNLVAVPTKARATDSGPVVDCRALADTNGDGKVDSQDTCIPIGGFLNGLRPIKLAQPLIDQARKGAPKAPAAPNLPVKVDPGAVTMSHPRFALGVADDKPTKVVKTVAAGAPKLCLFVDWAGMSNGANWDAVWFVDGKAMNHYSMLDYKWSFGPQGVNFWVCAVDNSKGLPAGLYEMGFFVEGQPVFAEGIVVTPANQTAAVVTTSWHNDTNKTICALAVNPFGSGPAGLNEMKPGDQIAPGGTYKLDLAEGKLTVEASDCDGQPIADSGGKAGGITITKDTKGPFSISEGDATSTTLAAVAGTGGSR